MERLAERARAEIPFFRGPAAAAGRVYLDSAATSLKPARVIEAMTRFYTESGVNVHRGSYALAEDASAEYEEARSTVARLIGMDPDEVVFTSGATAAIHLVAGGLRLDERATVVASLVEHHSAVLPWMNRHPIAWFDPVRDDLNRVDELLSRGDVGLLVVNACSNVSGIVLPVAEYAEIAHRRRVPLLVDAAQYVPHSAAPLVALGGDFVVFSGHKMLGPFGVGILAGRREQLERLEPRLGGGTVESVSRTSFRLRSLPARLEPGTPPIAEAIGLAEAIRCLVTAREDGAEAYERRLMQRLYEKLGSIPLVHVFEPEWAGARTPTISISVERDLIPVGQLGRLLHDRFGICVRAGHHCAHPYVVERGVGGTVRFSAMFYNTLEEVDRAADAVDRLMSGFRGGRAPERV